MSMSCPRCGSETVFRASHPRFRHPCHICDYEWRDASNPEQGILFEGQDIRVREYKGRDGRMKYAIERPPHGRDRPAALLDELDRERALQIGRSIHAHGGEFRAAEKSGWSEHSACS